MRLTAEGRLKLCLHSDKGMELKPLLRAGLSNEKIKEEYTKINMELLESLKVIVWTISALISFVLGETL